MINPFALFSVDIEKSRGFSPFFRWRTYFYKKTEILPRGTFIKKFGDLIDRKETLLTTFFLYLFITLLAPGQYLLEQSLLYRFAINAASVIYFLGFTRFILPYFLWYGLLYNVPWSWTQIASCFPITVVYVALLGLVLDSYEFWVLFFWFCFVIYVLVVVAVVITLLVLRRVIVNTMADSCENFDLWWPVAKQADHLQSALPAEIRGKVLRIEAENQYINVYTEHGDALLRMGLNKAAENLSAKAGLRIHRSHWVAWEQLESLHFHRGNPRVKLKGGPLLPISRRILPEVREKLVLSDH